MTRKLVREYVWGGAIIVHAILIALSKDVTTLPLLITNAIIYFNFHKE